MFVASKEPYNGLFGVFEDSLPCRYNRYILNQTLKENGIVNVNFEPIQLLGIIGNCCKGALRYSPNSYDGKDDSLPELYLMQELANFVFREKNELEIHDLYLSSKNISHRPKFHFLHNDEHWFAKFRHPNDPKDSGIIEFMYNTCAKSCGVIVSECKLILNNVFISKRFDVDSEGDNLHIATARALIGKPIINSDTKDYAILLQFTQWLTNDLFQVEQMYRRMIFNILTSVKDDHANNFSFICYNGIWKISPAYDLMFFDGYDGQRAMFVNGNANPNLNDVVRIGESVSISRERCLEIIDKVAMWCKLSHLMHSNNVIDV